VALAALLASGLAGGCAASPVGSYCHVIGDFFSTLYDLEPSDTYRSCLTSEENEQISLQGLTATQAQEVAAQSLFAYYCGEDQLAHPEVPGQPAACDQLQALLGDPTGD
jgi:hypothetical protein